VRRVIVSIVHFSHNATQLEQFTKGALYTLKMVVQDTHWKHFHPWNRTLLFLRWYRYFFARSL